MAGHVEYTKPEKPNAWNISPRLKTISAVLMFIGVICLALTLFSDKSRAWHAFSSVYFISLPLLWVVYFSQPFNMSLMLGGV